MSIPYQWQVWDVNATDLLVIDEHTKKMLPKNTPIIVVNKSNGENTVPRPLKSAAPAAEMELIIKSMSSMLCTSTLRV